MSKEDKGGESGIINLLVEGPGLKTVKFKIKKHNPLGKMMKRYCEKVGRDLAEVRFRFDGQLINMSDTALSLGLEEDDQIDVNVIETGGPQSAPDSKRKH